VNAFSRFQILFASLYVNPIFWGLQSTVKRNDTHPADTLKHPPPPSLHHTAEMGFLGHVALSAVSGSSAIQDAKTQALMPRSNKPANPNAVEIKCDLCGLKGESVGAGVRARELESVRERGHACFLQGCRAAGPWARAGARPRVRSRRSLSRVGAFCRLAQTHCGPTHTRTRTRPGKFHAREDV